MNRDTEPYSYLKAQAMSIIAGLAQTKDAQMTCPRRADYLAEHFIVNGSFSLEGGRRFLEDLGFGSNLVLALEEGEYQLFFEQPFLENQGGIGKDDSFAQ